MKKKRIVVTGMGVVSAFGNDVHQLYEKLLQGKSAISFIETFPCNDWPTRFAGIIRDFDPGDYVNKKLLRRVDSFIHYGMVAGKKALEMAGLTEEQLQHCDKSRIGVVIGSGMGGMGVFYEGVATIIEKGYRKLTPFFVPAIITDMAGALLAIDMGFTGPNYSVSTACATSNYAILSAAEEIMMGKADIMVCGGSEAPMNPIGLAGFVASHALSTRNDEPTKASRPWDKDRDGFVMGEGSGVLVLEELEHARRRGAKILAEFLGGSKNCDAFHMTDPKEDGSIVARCMQDAIKASGLAVEDINYVNAHATSTIMGDLCEIAALKQVFKEHIKNVKVNATKSMLGHCLGAAGGIEAIVTIMAILTGKLHPTTNLKNPAEEIAGIDVIPNSAIEHTVTAALSNSFGFGGHNATIVLAPYKE